eukprot:5059384-Ditylum_brightwellii.AAC.1
MADEVHYLGSALSVTQWSKFVATNVTWTVMHCVDHVLAVAAFRHKCPVVHWPILSSCDKCMYGAPSEQNKKSITWYEHFTNSKRPPVNHSKVDHNRLS